MQHHDVAVGQLEVLIVAAADTRHVADIFFWVIRVGRDRTERENCACADCVESNSAMINLVLRAALK